MWIQAFPSDERRQLWLPALTCDPCEAANPFKVISPSTFSSGPSDTGVMASTSKIQKHLMTDIVPGGHTLRATNKPFHQKQSKQLVRKKLHFMPYWVQTSKPIQKSYHSNKPAKPSLAPTCEHQAIIGGSTRGKSYLCAFPIAIWK